MTTSDSHEWSPNEEGLQALLTSECALPSSTEASRWPVTHPNTRQPSLESSRMRQQVKSLFRQFQQDQDTNTEWPTTYTAPYPADQPEPFFADLFHSAFTDTTHTAALTPVLHASMAAPHVVETSGTSLLGAPSTIWSPQSAASTRNGSPFDAPKSIPRSPRAQTPSSADARSPARSKKAPAKGWWKTEICKFWREGGGCRNEANCRWAHGLHELRRLETPDAVPTPEPANCWGTPLQTQAEEETQMLTCSLTSLPEENRAAALNSLWESVRQHCPSDLTQEYDTFIAGQPGVVTNVRYWKRVLNIFHKPIHHKVCDLCTASASPATVVTTSGSTCADASMYLKCCETCKAIVEYKCSSLNWNLIIVMNTNSNDTNTRIHQWGLRFASLLRSIDDGSWTIGKSTVDIFDVESVVDRWVQHERLVARATLLVKSLMESLALSRRFRLSSTEVVPSLSLLEWMALCEQPILFMALLQASFSVHSTSMPSKMMGTPVPRTPAKQTRATPCSKPLSSPSVLSTGLNSPDLQSSEDLLPPVTPKDTDQYLEGKPTTTGDSAPARAEGCTIMQM